MTLTEAERLNPPAADRRITSKDELKRRGSHVVTLPSGSVFRVRIPDLDMLVAADAVPEHLRAVALARVLGDTVGDQEATLVAETVQQAEGTAPATAEEILKATEKVRKQVDLHVFLVSEMVVEPDFTYEELARPDSPVSHEDMLFLVQIAMRERVTDATGVRLGVEPLSRHAQFRAAHGCGEDCEACADLQAALSSVDLGDLRLRM